MRTIRVLAIGIALFFIQACSHPIEIVGEGDVTSASGNRNCSLEKFIAADAVCSKNYVIGDYQETYYATPRAGWKFDHWGNYCTTVTTNECSFDVPAAYVQKAWFQTMPTLQAVFTTTTLIDTVTVNGRVWAQVDLFTNLSWSAIDAVCPNGPNGLCLNNAILNGHNMTGWTWASVANMNAFFNFLNPTCGLGPTLPGSCTLGSIASPIATGCNLAVYYVPPNYSDGFRFVGPYGCPQGFIQYNIVGITRSIVDVDNVWTAGMRFEASDPYVWSTKSLGTDVSQRWSVGDASHGAWFYRNP